MKKTTGYVVLAVAVGVFALMGAPKAHAAIVGYGGVPVTGGLLYFTPGIGQGQYNSPVNPYMPYGPNYNTASVYSGYNTGYNTYYPGPSYPSYPMQNYNNFNPVYTYPNYNYSYQMNYPSYSYPMYGGYMPYQPRYYY